MLRHFDYNLEASCHEKERGLSIFFLFSYFPFSLSISLVGDAQLTDGDLTETDKKTASIPNGNAVEILFDERKWQCNGKALLSRSRLSAPGPFASSSTEVLVVSLFSLSFSLSLFRVMAVFFR